MRFDSTHDSSIADDITPSQLAELCQLSTVKPKAGGGVMATCPAHTGQTGGTPPLSIDAGSQGTVAYCHSCGWTAGTLAAVAYCRGLPDNAAAARWLESQLGRSSGTLRQAMPIAADAIQERWQADTNNIDADTAGHWLSVYAAERHLTAAQLAAAEVTAARRNGKPALRLPARSASGGLVGWQDICGKDANGKRVKLSAAQLPAPVWGLPSVAALQPDGCVLLCEGASDYLTALAAAPADCAVLAAAGAAQLVSAARQAHALQPTATLCVIADADTAGLSAAAAAVKVWRGKWLILVPPAGQDLSDIHATNFAATPSGNAAAAVAATQRSLNSARLAARQAGVKVWPLLPAGQQARQADIDEVAALLADAQPPEPQPQEQPLPPPTELPDNLAAQLGGVVLAAQHPDTGAPYDLWHPAFDGAGILALLRAHATQLLLSPLALLGVVLAECVSSVAHNWLLPPPGGNDTTGAGSPLSLFVLLVAPPGVGKSEAAKQAAAIVSHSPHGAETTSSVSGYAAADKHAAIQSAGAPVSGEALAESLIAEVEVLDDDGNTERQRKAVRHRARWHYAEAEQLLTAGGRQGNTLAALLRAAWSGEALSTLTASQDRSRFVPALSYTIGLTACAQFDTAAPLLTATERGDSQRWLWLPANSAPDQAAETEAAQLAEANGGTLPSLPLAHWQLPLADRTDGSHTQIKVSADITADIVASRQAALYGTQLPDKLAAAAERTGAADNQHANQMRLRVAAAVCRLLGLPPNITPELWAWAGAVMTTDAQTRRLLASHAEAEAHITAAQRRAAATADKLHAAEAEVAAASRRIHELIEAAGRAIVAAARNNNGTLSNTQASRALPAATVAAAKAASVSRAELRQAALASLAELEQMFQAADGRWQLTDKKTN